MSNFIAEFFGTALLIFLGNGVVAGVVLRGTKNENSGWLVITIGWALAISFAVYAVGPFSGAHLNPAVTVALAATGQFPWANVGTYVAAQLLGAMLGAVLAYLHYLPHWSRTENPIAKLAVFAPPPAIRHPVGNFISEFLATFVFLFGLSVLGANRFAEGLNPLAVGALILTIGHSLGGTTGFSINPARDLGSRMAHTLLPIPGKGISDWGYAWLPVVASLLGGVCGAAAYILFF